MIPDSHVCIACPLEVDTFLAVTKIKPIDSERKRLTVKESRKHQAELESILLSDEPMPKDFWNLEKEETSKVKSFKRGSYKKAL